MGKGAVRLPKILVLTSQLSDRGARTCALYAGTTCNRKRHFFLLWRWGNGRDHADCSSAVWPLRTTTRPSHWQAQRPPYYHRPLRAGGRRARAHVRTIRAVAILRVVVDPPRGRLPLCGEGALSPRDHLREKRARGSFIFLFCGGAWP